MACGSYYCSECKFIIHVNCALQEAGWYYKIDSKDDFDKLNAMLEASTIDPNFLVTKMIKDRENVINTGIKHFSHHHNLVLSDEVKDRMYCDGCSQIILTSFYGCLECDFFLHKSCSGFAYRCILGNAAVLMVIQYIDARLAILICI
ncbi:hypothetical protein Goari_003512, partial [Gossypium aridum]|nr:hypothetical protein [Gossypium aridum]